jgi:outer membrane receptor protein involved in Fe transport
MPLMPLFSITAMGQATTGGIRGVVTDQTGAVVAKAKVTARNLATGIEHSSETTDVGVYSITRIPPGLYHVSVEAGGFKKAEIPSLEIPVGRDTVQDFGLEPGEVTETVTVTGTSEQLIEKDTAQISGRFQGERVRQLPINVAGSGLDRIALAMPGVTPGFGNVNGNGVTLSVNGNRARANNFTIDGVDNNDLSIGGPNYFVQNTDLVQEYQVITNNFSAEYGRNAGAIVNIVSRQGTNEYHGAVSWYHRDRKNWDSLTNIERRTGTQKDPTPNLVNVVTWGVGGPVIPSKAERGRFFFAGQIFRNPGLADLRTTSLAPTPAGVQALVAAFPNNAAVQYYANFSAFRLGLGNPEIRSDVPQSTITVGGVTVPMAAVRRVVPLPTNNKELNFRGDSQLSDTHNVWGRYFFQDAPNKHNLVDVRGWTGDIPVQTKQLGGGWTWNTSSRSVNEFRGNYSRLFVVFGGPSGGDYPGQIPHPDDIDKAATFLNPNFTAANGTALLSVGPATNLPQGRTVESLQFTDNFAWTFGKHQLKFGADIRLLDNSVPFLPNVNGNFLFSNAGQLASNAPTQLTVALGPASLTYDETDQFYYFQDDWRIKPNLTLNLGVRYENTGQPINLLHRVTAAREADASQAFWRQNLPIEARTNPAIPTDKNNWAPRLGFVYTPRFEGGLLGRLFGEDKTIMRGGFGITYDPAFYNLMLNISTSAPTVFLTAVGGFGIPSATPTGDKVRDAVVAAGIIRFNTFDPRFLSRTTINPAFRSPYVQQWSFGIQRELPRDIVVETRYVGNHQVGLFQTINANPSMANLINGFPRTYREVGATTNSTLTFPGFPQLFPGVTPLTCVNDPATPDNEAACNGRLRGFGVARERINGAQATYHSLQNRFEARPWNWLSFGFNYTWSHAIDNSSEVFSFAGGNSVTVSQNPLDLTRDEKGESGFDARHVTSFYWVWELPWMRDQKGILGRIAGGWQLSGIGRIQSERRFTPLQLAGRNPYEDTTFLLTFIGGNSHLRPFGGNPNAPKNRVAITDIDACLFWGFCGTSGGQPILRRSSTGFFLVNDLNRFDASGSRIFTPVTSDDVRFIINGPGAAQRFGTPFGNIGRNTFRGDRIEALDLSVYKTTRITERVAIQYRFNMFNALNHPTFGIPNSINLENAGTTYFNFQENSGGRRVLEMALRVMW